MMQTSQVWLMPRVVEGKESFVVYSRPVSTYRRSCLHTVSSGNGVRGKNKHGAKSN